MQVTANNIRKVHMRDLLLPPRRALPLAPSQLLSGLCGLLDQFLMANTSSAKYPLPQNLQLALLLSAATAGVPASHPTQGQSTATRNQVNASPQNKVLCLLPCCNTQLTH